MMKWSCQNIGLFGRRTIWNVRLGKSEVDVFGFGKKDDCCFVTEVNGKIVGAVWTGL